MTVVHTRDSVFSQPPEPVSRFVVNWNCGEVRNEPRFYLVLFFIIRDATTPSAPIRIGLPIALTIHGCSLT